MRIKINHFITIGLILIFVLQLVAPVEGIPFIDPYGNSLLFSSFIIIPLLFLGYGIYLLLYEWRDYWKKIGEESKTPEQAGEDEKQELPLDKEKENLVE